MTDTITITRFYSGKRGYSKADASLIPLNTEHRLHEITDFIDNAVVQLRHGHGEPRGISFCAYKGRGVVNRDQHIQGCYALALDYRVGQFPQLREAAVRLGYAHLYIEGENRAGTVNAITVVFPLSAPVTTSQYARLASCIVTELGVYGLLEGALAASHIINIHATTLTAYERGELLDGAAYIKRTANLFQDLDARRFEKDMAPVKPATPERPTYVTEDGLFEMQATDAEITMRRAQALIHGRADLTAYGELLD